MARKARFCQPGIPVLLYQKTSPEIDIIHDAVDIVTMQRFIADSVARLDCDLHAYGLLANQLWLVLTPGQPTSVPRLMQSLGRRYAAHFFKRYPDLARGRKNLWGQRYRCIPLEAERYLVKSMCFVENRVKQVLCGNEGNVSVGFCSRQYVDQAGETLPVTAPEQFRMLSPDRKQRKEKYCSLGNVLQGSRCESRIAEAIKSQSALGSSGFVHALEIVSGVRLSPRKPGRPRKIDP